MKLAEALLLRADLQRKIASLNARITPLLIIRKGRDPQEDPIKLLAIMRKAIADLEVIVVKINKTNVITKLNDERTLMEALANRDALKSMVEQLRMIRRSAQLNGHSYDDMRTTVNVKNLQSEIDQTGRSFRELDSQVQGLNWTTDIIE
ncbi:DIP1984 family protein [Saprospiraceae bacterium]|jgi:hypothetical protein|nr:DIP1984 family protein [Saprospiraceae bacterium]